MDLTHFWVCYVFSNAHMTVGNECLPMFLKWSFFINKEPKLIYNNFLLKIDWTL